MRNLKLIALDMDGTLLNDDGVVTSYTAEVIERALNRGIHVVLCTGRPLPLCASFYEELDLSSYIITSNGAEIWDENYELITHFPLHSERIEQLWNFGREHNLHMWMVSREDVFGSSRRPDNFHEHTWLKMGYGNLTEEDKQFVLQYLEQFSDLEITNSSLKNIEVNRNGIHKANAIRIICERLGITMDHVIAIGDSLNDYKMIEQAGVGVAVKNAQQPILQIADYVTKSNNDNGVALAIEKFVLAE